MSNKKLKYNQETIINEFIKLFDNKFDYSETQYVKLDNKIKIKCNNHNVYFEQKPIHHLKGRGCVECTREKLSSSNNNKKTHDKFIEEAKEKYKDQHSYEFTKYINTRTKVKIRCIKHNHVFEKIPKLYLNGKESCPKCGYEKMANGQSYNTETFIKNSIEIHGSLYGYDKLNYISMRKKVEIFCKIHNEYFWQIAESHKNGINCPKCGKQKAALSRSYVPKQISKRETAWLDSMNIANRQVAILGYNIDGYDPLTNTIYEFQGDYYHGNPKVFHEYYYNTKVNAFMCELYEYTQIKINALKKAGYNVIEMWENDFEPIYKRIIQKQRLEEFIKQSKLLYGDRYCYEKVEYKTKGTTIILHDKIENKFIKITPNKHLK